MKALIQTNGSQQSHYGDKQGEMNDEQTGFTLNVQPSDKPKSVGVIFIVTRSCVV
ncbi:hypothetical protein [Spirosoma oryzicola]|uniref:hypothetical protein n=1 Tax=Spirosoma oryzicola TaxID=2898794 RepID=UPI001E4E7ECA|nr:hypothetical protein [Spirosoma oryzicola]UHG89778.1 hypothetical protein LQ777_16170 [Spirosoma oryzicola]